MSFGIEFNVIRFGAVQRIDNTVDGFFDPKYVLPRGKSQSRVTPRYISQVTIKRVGTLSDIYPGPRHVEEGKTKLVFKDMDPRCSAIFQRTGLTKFLMSQPAIGSFAIRIAKSCSTTLDKCPWGVFVVSGNDTSKLTEWENSSLTREEKQRNLKARDQFIIEESYRHQPLVWAPSL